MDLLRKFGWTGARFRCTPDLHKIRAAIGEVESAASSEMSQSHSSRKHEHPFYENTLTGVMEKVMRNTSRVCLGDITNGSVSGGPRPPSTIRSESRVSGVTSSVRSVYPPPLPLPRAAAGLEVFSGDEADSENHQCVVEYVQDVYVHLRAEEEVGQASPEYMDNQPE